MRTTKREPLSAETPTPKHIAILTGSFGSGKTTACFQLVELAHGVLTLAWTIKRRVTNSD